MRFVQGETHDITKGYLLAVGKTDLRGAKPIYIHPLTPETGITWVSWEEGMRNGYALAMGAVDPTPIPGSMSLVVLWVGRIDCDLRITFNPQRQSELPKMELKIWHHPWFSEKDVERVYIEFRDVQECFQWMGFKNIQEYYQYVKETW